MPLINVADAIYVGTNVVDAVYKGTTLVYSGSPPPPTYAVFDATRLGTGGGGVLTLGDSRFQRTSAGTGYAVAISNTPLVGKIYFEMRVCLTGTTATDIGAGVRAQAAGAPNNQYTGQTTAGVSAFPRQFDWVRYNNGGTVFNYGPDETHPVWTFGYAVDVPNRRVWIRQTAPGGNSLWGGGGDPVAGTTPTATLTGSDPMYASGSISPAVGTLYIDLVSDPSNHLSAPPAGYTAGIIIP